MIFFWIFSDDLFGIFGSVLLKIPEWILREWEYLFEFSEHLFGRLLVEFILEMLRVCGIRLTSLVS